MKRLFTLFAVALVCSSMFGQANWTNLVENGDVEGDNLSNFWVQEFRNPEEARTDGLPNVVEDSQKEGNHCIAVRARSAAEGGGSIERYDTQFFITVSEAIPSGKELRLTMLMRADKAAHFGTQAHQGPGDYNDYNSFGEHDVTTEWAKISWQGEVTTAMTQEGAEPAKEFRTIAFDLSDFKDGNTYYFDDIKLEVRDAREPAEFKGWFNMLRHGTESKDAIGNFTTFTSRDGATGTDEPAHLVDDPDGGKALCVTSIGYNATYQDEVKEEILDEDGNPVLDEEGNPTYNVRYEEKPCYITEEGDTLKLQQGGAYGIDDFRTQFFVTGVHKFATNSKYRVKFWARADKPCTIQTQAHRMPGNYIHYELLGDLQLTTEWQPFEFEKDVTSQQSGSTSFQTIAFNCNVLKDEPNVVYFRFEEFSANAADVTDEERTLGSEDVKVLLPTADQMDGETGTIDFTKCKEVLEYDSFETLVNQNMSAQVDEESFGYVDPTAGCPLTDDGMLAEDETNLAVEMDEVTDDDTALTLHVYNLGLPEDIKTVNSKFRFSYNNWFYIYNVSFQSADIFDGIEEVKAQPEAAKTDVIYDLSGRRVKNMGKGIYIINGKKYIK